MNWLFALLAIIIMYAYVGYPVLLWILSSLFGKETKKADDTPSISIIISAHNEEKSILRKIQETLALDYPEHKREIIIASDGSTDRTNEVVSSVGINEVRLLAFKERKGKTHVQNEAVKEAHGEIIVFSDATTTYARDLLKNLVRGFSDERVWAIGGELVFVNPNNHIIGEGNGFYWRYEKSLKRAESSLTSLIGVSGCCYAVRRSVYQTIPSDLISDFVIAPLLYKEGGRVVYEPEAVAYEEANISASDEFKMRVRIAVRSLFGLYAIREMLNPLRYGFYSIQLLSHKLLRYLIPLFLVMLLLVSAIGTFFSRAPFYSWALALQIVFYSFALYGYFSRSTLRIFFIPYYACLSNYALLIAICRFLRGERYVFWKPIRK